MSKANDSLVSVIVNCYNGEKYLSETLDSVLNQTYKNWEVIFWDNRSTDASAKIFKNYKDTRFKYFYADEHTPLGEARNLAVKKADGDFICFLDSDDLWDKEKLEKQMSYFSNSEVGVVYSNFWILKKNKKKLFTNKELPRGNIYKELIRNYNVGILSVVIRKDFFLKLEKKFDERFSMLEDFDLIIRLSKLCFFESIQTPLCSYRLHSDNLTNTSKEKEVEEFEIWLKDNEASMNLNDVNKIKKDIKNRRFLNSKIDGNYEKCIKMLFDFKINIISLKNLTVFILPNIILKRFSRWL